MFDLDCDWMQHPFPSNHFEITSEDQIVKIRQSGIQELYIDTSKGLDIEDDEVLNPDKPGTDPSLEVGALKTVQDGSLAEEIIRAIGIKRETLKAVAHMMDGVRQGKLINVDQVTPPIEEMVSSIIRNRDALIALTRIRKIDQYTFEHAVAVSVLLVAFGESLALDKEELVQLGIGGLLMDIGKSKIPIHILNKPAALKDNELVIARKHVEKGLEILERIPDISTIVMDIAAEHHERFDGSGYPSRKKGNGISLYGQMAAIADVYDALTTNRVYRACITPHAAMKLLMNAGTLFNQELMQQFIHCIGIYPVGSLVALSNGLFAVVIKSGEKGLLYPVVRIIFNSTERRFIEPMDIDLADQCSKGGIKIVSVVEPGKWRINPVEFMDYPSS